MNTKHVFLLLEGVLLLGAASISAQNAPPAPPPFFEGLRRTGPGATSPASAGTGVLRMRTDPGLASVPAWGRWQWFGMRELERRRVWGATVFHYAAGRTSPRGLDLDSAQEYGPAWVQWCALKGIGAGPRLRARIFAGFFAFDRAEGGGLCLGSEGSLAAQSLELIAAAGLNPSTLPQWSASSRCGAPCAAPSTCGLPGAALYLQPSTFSVGSSWWLWDDSWRLRRRSVHPAPGVCPPRRTVCAGASSAPHVEHVHAAFHVRAGATGPKRPRTPGDRPQRRRLPVRLPRRGPSLRPADCLGGRGGAQPLNRR